MEYYLDTLKHPRHNRVYNSRTSFVEEVIHVRFTDTKLDTEISELHEPFSYLRLDEGIGPMIKQSTKVGTSNQEAK